MCGGGGEGWTKGVPHLVQHEVSLREALHVVRVSARAFDMQETTQGIPFGGEHVRKEST